MGLLGKTLDIICGEYSKEAIDSKIVSLMAQKRSTKDRNLKNQLQNQIDNLRVKKRYMK